MKRVKIMLAVIAVLTTAGGVLAFRISEAKRGIAICTRPIQAGQQCATNLPCLNPTIFVKFLAGAPNTCYYSLPPNLRCDQLRCSLKALVVQQ